MSVPIKYHNGNEWVTVDAGAIVDDAGNRISATEARGHIDDTIKHITSEERTIWNGKVESNELALLKEKLERNQYDDYQLWLELYYKGHISHVETDNAKAMTFDGFMDLDNVEDATRYDITTATKDSEKTYAINGTDAYYVKFTPNNSFRSLRKIIIPLYSQGGYQEYFYFRILGEKTDGTGQPDKNNTIHEASFYDSDSDTSTIQTTSLQYGLSSLTYTLTSIEMVLDKHVTLEDGKNYFFEIDSSTSATWAVYYNDGLNVAINPNHQLWVSSDDGSTYAQIANREIIMSWESMATSAQVDLVSQELITGNIPVIASPNSKTLYEDPDDTNTQTTLGTQVIDGDSTTYYSFSLYDSVASSYKYCGNEFDMGYVGIFDSLVIKMHGYGSGSHRYTCQKILFSEDGVNWTEIPYADLGGDKNLSSILFTSNHSIYETYKITFKPTKARYIRVVDYYANGSTSNSSTFYIHEYEFKQKKGFTTSDLYTDVKELPFTATNADIYISVNETVSANVAPSISFDGGLTFENMSLFEEREDSKFNGYIEKRYQVSGSGTDIKIKLTLTSDAQGNELAQVKRYGLLIS